MASLWMVVSNTFPALESAIWILDILAIIYVVRCFVRASLLHFNLKLVLINCSTCLALYGLGRLGMNLDSALQFYGVGPANLACRNLLIIPKILIIMGLLMGMMSVVISTIERTVATFIPKKYEQMKKTKFELVLLIITWVTGISVALAVQLASRKEVNHCDRADPSDSAFILHIHTEFMLGIFTTSVIACCANGLVLYALYRHNKKMRSELTLAELNVRYQYTENIITTRFLLALTAANVTVAIVCLALVVFYLIARVTHLSPHVDLIFIEQSFNLVIASYGFLFNILCLRMYRPNRDQLLRDINRIPYFRRKAKVEQMASQQVKSVEGHVLSFKNEGSVYFSFLAQQWNATPKLAWS
uniref:G_PROTEIN_RECEP_F1_2 domain-containing protein n=1 Tax=Steinernema glaseri TaxID=37863 RepID=A0A1I8AEL0_9BILA